MALRVLLAEDDRDIRAVARLSLKRAGFDVVVVESGEDAIEAAAQALPDVVLLDWLLPGMDGLETLSALRAKASTAAIPVIFLTARTHPTETARAMAEGAIGCLGKPFNALTLGDEVQRLLESWRAQR
jgi:CheY-like chemotaxis protein